MLHALQAQVWDLPDLDVVPSDILLALIHSGALLAGAYIDGVLAAFVLGFPTDDPLTQHSHMLGVHPDYRRLGLARRLKLHQRDWCRARGITRIVWTYDPLKVPNASFNIEVLGATSCTYLPNYYGNLGGIDAGAPSDRLLAEWHLDRPRIDGTPPNAPNLNDPLTGEPVGEGVLPDTQHAWLHVPANFGDLLSRQPHLARAWRERTAPLFTIAFANGYRVVRFRTAPHPAYLLERDES